MTKVTIYSTATCGFCHMLKNYLSMHKVPFEEKKADTDPSLAQELYDKSGQLGVPFSIIEKDGKQDSVLGFDRARIDELLGLSR